MRGALLPLFAAQIARRWRGCGEGRGAGYRTHLHQLVNTYTLNPVRLRRGAPAGDESHIRDVWSLTYMASTRQISGVPKNRNKGDARQSRLRTSKLLNASVNRLLQNDFCLLQKREMWSNGTTGASNTTSCRTELQRLRKYQEDSSTQLVKAENKTQ